MPFDRDLAVIAGRAELQTLREESKTGLQNPCAGLTKKRIAYGAGRGEGNAGSKGRGDLLRARGRDYPGFSVEKSARSRSLAAAGDSGAWVKIFWMRSSALSPSPTPW